MVEKSQKKRGEKMTIGEMFIEYRAKHNLSQREFAKIMGMSASNVSRIEVGKNKPHKAKEMNYKIKIQNLEKGEK